MLLLKLPVLMHSCLYRCLVKTDLHLREVSAVKGRCVELPTMLEYILYQLCCLTMSHVIIEAPEEMLVIPTVIL